MARTTTAARESASAPPPAGGFRPSDSLRVSIELMSEIVGGSAGAVSEGFQAFSDEFSHENVREHGVFNGFVEGMIAGQSRFLRSLAETADRVQDSFRDLEGTARERPVAEPIDYERLAKAVAAELRRQDAKRPDDVQK